MATSTGVPACTARPTSIDASTGSPISTEDAPEDEDSGTKRIKRFQLAVVRYREPG